MPGPKMSMDVKISRSPSAPAVQAEIKKKQRGISDFSKVHKKASIMLDAWVQRNFSAEGSKLTGGDAWPPFQRAGRWMRGKGLDTAAKLLQDTGALRASHLPFHSKKDAGIGSDLPYAKFHDEGTGVPMRRTLPVAKEVQAALLVLFDQHAEEALQ